MITKEWTWTSNDRYQIFSQSWEPEIKPKAVVCVLHGLGEHSGRYAHVGKAFVEAGYALSGFDLRGNGKSGGTRGHYPSLKVLMDDIHQQCLQIEHRFPEVPQVLYGHSLGGLFALVYATYRKNSLVGVIATAPALRSPILEQKIKMSLVRILGGLLPKLSVPTGLDPNSISRDPAVVRAYVNDPLVHGKATLSTGKVGLQVIDWVLSHTDPFPIPVLILHGKEDTLVYPRGSEELAKLIKGKLTFKLLDGLHHEIHNEPEKEQVFRHMIDWLNTQLILK
ncbi:MAG: alpha/beta hydrolase [Anaerolineae bacterium]|nr:alpha/beta hydrolase [Anaerolineae bacterium]MDK1080608.1 alpha/beta hydrolase [Anaerolineae bacterium]MDK1117598.1 alpha/beta hydrolase [Anaerolineae bacterium]